VQRTLLPEAVELLRDRGGGLGGRGVEGRGAFVEAGFERVQLPGAVRGGRCDGVWLRGQRSSLGRVRALGTDAAAWTRSMGARMLGAARPTRAGDASEDHHVLGERWTRAVAAAKKSERRLARRGRGNACQAAPSAQRPPTAPQRLAARVRLRPTAALRRRPSSSPRRRAACPLRCDAETRRR
jgi:hypothetical protein